MGQEEPGLDGPAGEDDGPGPVVFYDPDPPAPLLGPVGVLLTLATFFYFFL